MSSTILGEKGVFSFVAIRWASRRQGFLRMGSVSALSTAVELFDGDASVGGEPVVLVHES